eukprot:COSAG01_NODE_24550_length_775_cov_0.899408_2_plen_69_part_01
MPANGVMDPRQWPAVPGVLVSDCHGAVSRCGDDAWRTAAAWRSRSRSSSRQRTRCCINILCLSRSRSSS